MIRKAGEILGTLGLGVGGAVAADAMAHDDMDRVAQGYKDFTSGFQGSDETTQQVYAAVFAQGEMSIKDRILATGILSGELPPGAAEEAKKMADTPAGKKGIDLAGQVMANRPELGAPVAGLANQELALFAKEHQMGVGPSEVMAAAQEGAGVSPIPAALGAVAGGGLGAGAMKLAQVMRGRGGR